MTENSASDAAIERSAPPVADVLSVNQIVSYNLFRARRSAGWTQQDVAELLERYTGRGWSNASVSAAERAWQGGRPRRFDASEIVALAKIFDQPISYFFLPRDGAGGSKWVGMREFPEGKPVVDPLDRQHDLMALIATADLLQMIGIPYSPDFTERLRKLLAQFMGMTWEPPQWGVRLRVLQDVADLERVGEPFDESDPKVYPRFPEAPEGEKSTRSSNVGSADIESMKNQVRREFADEIVGNSRTPWEVLRRTADLIEYLEHMNQTGGVES